MIHPEFADYLRHGLTGPNEPAKPHEWRIVDEGNGWYNVNNGTGGYLIRGYELACELLKLSIDADNTTPETDEMGA